MISKNVKIVSGVFLALILAFGCLGSGSENKQVVEAPAVQAETVQAPANDNTAWIQSQAKYCGIIGPELSSAGDAINNYDYNSMVIYGQKIEADAAAAFQESNNYSVSPRYQEAKRNWEIALLNYQTAGKYIKIVGTEKGTNQENIQNVINYCETGTAYFKQCKNSM
jgi:hypothetical protein